jgi:hypothetical protein
MKRYLKLLVTLLVLLGPLQASVFYPNNTGQSYSQNVYVTNIGTIDYYDAWTMDYIYTDYVNNGGYQPFNVPPGGLTLNDQLWTGTGYSNGYYYDVNITSYYSY